MSSCSTPGEAGLSTFHTPVVGRLRDRLRAFPPHDGAHPAGAVSDRMEHVADRHSFVALPPQPLQERIEKDRRRAWIWLKLPTTSSPGRCRQLLQRKTPASWRASLLVCAEIRRAQPGGIPAEVLVLLRSRIRCGFGTARQFAG